MSHKAVGKHYFGAGGFPLTAVRVRSSNPTASHPFDLTEVEHDHDFNELVIVVQGQAMQRLEGDEYPVSAGDVYVLQSRHRHYFHERKNLELINIMYDPRHLPLPDALLRKMPGYSALFLLEPRYRRAHRFTSRLHLDRVALARAEELAEAIMIETASNDPGREASMLAHLLALMVHVSRQYERTENVDGLALLRIGEVLGAMERDSARAWTLDELCAITHMARSTFFRIFHDATGQAPIDYLIQIRVQEAMRLLREGRDSITDTGLACGFSDGNYFTRQFKKHLGITPSAYRRSLDRPRISRKNKIPY